MRAANLEQELRRAFSFPLLFDHGHALSLPAGFH
jgi:hypothetical protein